jgi:hypothetical protein
LFSFQSKSNAYSMENLKNKNQHKGGKQSFIIAIQR